MWRRLSLKALATVDHMTAAARAYRSASRSVFMQKRHGRLAVEAQLVEALEQLVAHHELAPLRDPCGLGAPAAPHHHLHGLLQREALCELLHGFLENARVAHFFHEPTRYDRVRLLVPDRHRRACRRAIPAAEAAQEPLRPVGGTGELGAAGELAGVGHAYPAGKVVEYLGIASVEQADHLV